MERLELDNVIVITSAPASRRSSSKPEICEHKGIGHPDSICDGVAEAVSRALSREYLRTYGEVQHNNVDKALLVGGESAPRFGGGKLITPIWLIVAGRASPVRGLDMPEFVEQAARRYLESTLHCDPAIFQIESAVRPGSASLQQVFLRGRTVHIANDTSFGAGFAPHSALEQMVLRLAEVMRSDEFRSTFPAAGDDYKVMGARVGATMHFTVALAFVDREVADGPRYFEIKAELARYLENTIDAQGSIEINALDSPHAETEDGLYLTVTGLSAEHGDDGEVGRGNRVNGLITPCRPMSLEAAAGKNPVAHVGKIYNVLAMEMARAICGGVESVAEASVQILSTIGKPIAEPQLVAIDLVMRKSTAGFPEVEIRKIARSYLERVAEFSEKLIRGEIQVF